VIFDMDQPVVADGLAVFPDWVFASIPVQAVNIKETVTIGGRSDSSISITGTADAPEN
jgi:hypothetical protein